MQTALSLAAKPPIVRNLIGGDIRPWRADEIGRVRFKVHHWIIDLRAGDFILWNPTRKVDSIAVFHVLRSEPIKGRNGCYIGELGRVAAAVTILGTTYQRPSPYSHFIEI